MCAERQVYDPERIAVQHLRETFERSIGHRVLIMMSQFPFFLVGTIKAVRFNLLTLHVDTAQLQLFEGRDVHVRIEAVRVFYIESPEAPIPRLPTADTTEEK